MGVFALSIPIAVAFLLPIAPAFQSSMPRMSGVEPGTGRTGEVLVIHGENLGPDCVAALYLTDGKTDLKVALIEQSATAIKFKIPAEAKPGRLALMVLTREAEPKLIEQPVKVTIDGQ